MQLTFWIAVFVALAAVLGVLVAFFVSVFKIGQDRWREAAELTGSTKAALAGEVETDRDGLRDPRVAKGKVWNKVTQKWQSQGKLSDEYLKNMVG